MNRLLATVLLLLLSTTTLVYRAGAQEAVDLGLPVPLWEPVWSPRFFAFRCSTSPHVDVLGSFCEFEVGLNGPPGILIAGTYPHILIPGLDGRFALDLSVVNPSMQRNYLECERSGTRFPQQDVLSGDLNHDGNQDMLAINSNGIHVYLGTRTPVRGELANCSENSICEIWEFETSEVDDSTYPISGNHSYYLHAQLQDYDVDGNLDIALFYEGEFGVRYGDGKGGFSESELLLEVPGIPQSVLWGTFQGSYGFWILTHESAHSELAAEADDAGLWFLREGTNKVEKILDVYGVSLTSGDFNADGFDDLALITFINEFSIYLSSEDGFSLLGTHQIDIDPMGKIAGDRFLDVAVGDFNGDGYSDIAAFQREPAELLLYYNRQDGSFHPPVQHTLGLPPELVSQLEDSNANIIHEGINDVLVLDINADGGDDLVFLQDDFIVQVLIPTSEPLGYGLQNDGPYRQEHAADLNNDGVVELLSVREHWTEHSCDQSEIFQIDFSSSGILNTRSFLRLGGSDDCICYNVKEIATADLNEDDFLDVVVLSSCDNDKGTTSYQVVSVWAGNGSTAGPSPMWSYAFSPEEQLSYSLHIWDFDGDQMDDIGVVLQSGEKMGVFATTELQEMGSIPPLLWLDISDIRLFEPIKLPDAQSAIIGVRPTEPESIAGPQEIVLVSRDGIRPIAETDSFTITGLVAHDWTGDSIEDITMIGLKIVDPINKASIGFRQVWGHEHEAMAVVLGFFEGALSGDFIATFQEIENWPFGMRPYRTSKPITGDFDGDGDCDLALSANNLEAQDVVVVVLLWHEESFGQLAELHPIESGWLFPADINIDGKDEILVDIWSGPICILSLTEQVLNDF